MFFGIYWHRFSLKIAPTLTDSSIHDYLENRNANSMFLSPTNDEEILASLGTCNNKTSTDSNGISMDIVKGITTPNA